jgi:signal transduction histidine kinase
VRVEVCDDGCGIDPALLAGGQREGHWGLIGMRERARALGATLSLASTPGNGTLVRLFLPRWRGAR